MALTGGGGLFETCPHISSVPAGAPQRTAHVNVHLSPARRNTHMHRSEALARRFASLRRRRVGRLRAATVSAILPPSARRRASASVVSVLRPPQPSLYASPLGRARRRAPATSESLPRVVVKLMLHEHAGSCRSPYCQRGESLSHRSPPPSLRHRVTHHHLSFVSLRRNFKVPAPVSHYR